MAAPEITISNITCHLPKRYRITWTASNVDDTVSYPYPSSVHVQINGSWYEGASLVPDGCPVPLPPGHACADQGVDFLAHQALVDLHGVTQVRLDWASFDSIVIELPSTCGG